MAFAGMCPYLRDARSCDRTICECAKFTFPDRVARREVLYSYCGHPTGWKNCTFKAVMDRYYDRKYSGEAEEPITHRKHKRVTSNKSNKKKESLKKDAAQADSLES